MHTVAREYALRIHLKLAKLMDNLPATNDPGCSAGYAHGLVTAVAPEIEKAGPTVANKLCAESETRYQRYSCTHGFGHAFMRLNNDNIAPSLQMCGQLGTGAAPDCAQGIYHDYWFSMNGIDDTRSRRNRSPSRASCAAPSPPSSCAPAGTARSWRPRTAPAWSPRRDFEELCGGLEGLQRHACVTGASVIGPPDPRNQLTVCAALEDVQDVEACIRGTKVQNLLNFDPQLRIDLIQDCNKTFQGAIALTCDRWLGKTLGVISDGKFRDRRLPQAPHPRRAQGVRRRA